MTIDYNDLQSRGMSNTGTGANLPTPASTTNNINLGEKDDWRKDYQHDYDNLFQDTLQILVGEPLVGLHTGYKSATMGEGEAYLHDYGGVFTKEQKYIGDQSGLEKFATGVDVLSSAATLGSIAMIAGGVLAAPFTSGTSLALAGKGAVGLGATWGIKGLTTGATKAIKGITGIAKKADNAKKLINDDFLKQLASSGDKDFIKQLLGEKFSSANKADIFSKTNIDETAERLTNISDFNTIEKHLDFNIVNTYGDLTKPLRTNLEAIEMEAKFNKGLNDFAGKESKFLKDAGISDDIVGDITRSTDKVAKAQRTIHKDIAKLGSVKEQLIKATPVGGKIVDLKKATQEFADIKKTIEVETMLKQNNLDKLTKKVNIAKVDEIDKLFTRSDFLSGDELVTLQSMVKSKKIVHQYQLDELKESLLSEIGAISKKVTSNKTKNINKVASRIATKHQTISYVKAVKGVDSKVIGNVNKNIKDYKKAIQKIPKADRVKSEKAFIGKNAKELKKVLNSNVFTKRQAVYLSTALTKADTVTKLIKLMDKINDISNKYGSSLIKKEANLIKQNKKTIHRTLTSKGGDMNKLMNNLQKFADNVGAEADVNIFLLKEAFDKYKNLDINKMTSLQIEEATNNLLKNVDLFKKKVIDAKVKVETQKAVVANNIQIKADLLNSGSFDNVKEFFGPGMLAGIKRSFYTLGVQGNQYNLIDRYAIDDGPLRQIFYEPQARAMGAIETDSAFFKITIEEKMADGGLNTPKYEGMMDDYVNLHRKDEGLTARKDYIQIDENWDVIQDNIDYSKIDNAKVIKTADEKLDKLWKENPEDYKLFTKEEKALASTRMYRSEIIEEYYQQLTKWINGPSKEGSAFKDIMEQSKHTLAKTYDDSKQITRIYDSKETIPVDVKDYTYKLTKKKEKGAAEKLEVLQDTTSAEVFSGRPGATSHPSNITPRVKNANLKNMTKTANPDYLLTRNFSYNVNNHYKDLLKYNHMRPVQYEIGRILEKSKGSLGETFQSFTNNEVYTNATYAYVGNKSGVEKFVDTISRNAVYGILGFKASTGVAQLTAIPEWASTFNSPASAMKAWNHGNKMLKGNEELINNFMRTRSSEWVQRADPRYSKAATPVRYTGSDEALDTRAYKVKNKAQKAYDLTKEASMWHIKTLDSALYKRSLIGSYIYQAEKMGLKSDPMLMFGSKNVDYAEALMRAEHQVADGMGSTNIANKSMFLKIGQLGKTGMTGRNQTAVRAITLFQSFVYNSFYRMVNNGLIKPTKMWKMGNKAGAAQQAANSAVMELMGKMMYVENGEKVRRLTDLYLGGDGEPSEYDQKSALEKLKGEYIGHIPIVGAISSSTDFSENKGVPSHIDGTLGLIDIALGVTIGDEEFADVTDYQRDKFAKNLLVFAGVPGATQFSDVLYKYKDNHLPEVEMMKKEAKEASKDVARQNKELVEVYLEDKNQILVENNDITPEKVLEMMKSEEPSRYKRVWREIQISTNYDSDTADEITKILKLSNSQKAVHLLGLEDEAQTNMIEALKSVNSWSKQMNKTYNQTKLEQGE